MFFSKKELTHIIMPVVKKSPRRISRLNELTEHNNWFVFGNYVYDLTPLVRNHPAGFKIVEPLRGEQVDKYMYGMDRSALDSSIPKHSHSAKSLELVGSPKAEIAIPSVFNGFDKDIVSVKAVSVKAISKHVYELRLVKAEGFNFEYQGYSL